MNKYCTVPGHRTGSSVLGRPARQGDRGVSRFLSVASPSCSLSQLCFPSHPHPNECRLGAKRLGLIVLCFARVSWVVQSNHSLRCELLRVALATSVGLNNPALRGLNIRQTDSCLHSPHSTHTDRQTDEDCTGGHAQRARTGDPSVRTHLRR